MFKKLLIFILFILSLISVGFSAIVQLPNGVIDGITYIQLNNTLY